MQYDNTNRGQIWPNDKKETENHPDYKGSINIEGKEYWLSAWKRKEGANPKAPVLSFSVQAKDEVIKAGNAALNNEQSDGNSFDDSFSDSIPF